MSVYQLICSYCQQNFERDRPREGERCYCSRQCQSKHQSELRSDDYTMFRYMYRNARRHAKQKGREFDITLDDIKDVWEKQNQRCNLTGVKLIIGATDYEKKHSVNTASLDRIDSSKGYLKNNIQIIHKDLQDIKSNLPQDYLVNWACLIADYHRGCMNESIDPPLLDKLATPCYTNFVDNDPNFVPF